MQFSKYPHPPTLDKGKIALPSALIVRLDLIISGQGVCVEEIPVISRLGHLFLNKKPFESASLLLWDGKQWLIHWPASQSEDEDEMGAKPPDNLQCIYSPAEK